MSTEEHPAESEDPTEALLRAWAGGDEDALGQLLRDNQQWLLMKARREMRLGDRATLESVDLVQEGLTRMLRNGLRYTPRSRGEFRALMAKVLRGTLADDRAKRMATKRAAHRVERLPEEGLSKVVVAGSGIATPSGVFAERERLDALADAIAELPEEQREICRRKYFDGETFEEIADAMGLPGSDAVRMRFNRSLPKLARALQQRGQAD